MRVYRISPCKFINDLSGYGAFVNGGRWNTEGIRMLYTSSSASLALLETLVHLPSYLVNKDYCLLTLEVPDQFIMKTNEDDLPQEWNAFPFIYQTQQFGNKFIQEGNYLGLQIPSAVIALETNILLNPGHKNFNKIKIISQEKLQIDKRLKT